MNPTQQLKRELWHRFGTKEHPAEWDGHVYGGGKLSQRYWEYFKAIELLELDTNSIILDIGGGSPLTGMGFFASLLATVAKHVYIIDPEIAAHVSPPNNVTFIRQKGEFETLQALFLEHPEITHVSCISVFEHIVPPTRRWMIQAVNDHFQGAHFVTTLEFHPKRTYFEHQLTSSTLSTLFQPFTQFYVDEFCASPVWCENALSDGEEIPRWYPLAVRFARV